MRATLAEVEELVDASGVTPALELAMPAGGRPRQLPVRSLVLGILLALADDRPAHLSRVHQALVALAEADQARLGVVVETPRGPHRLTYRQVERTFNTLMSLLDPSPVPSFAGVEGPKRAAHLATRRARVDVEAREARLTRLCDALVEASVPASHKEASTSVAVDWSDHAGWSRPTGPEEIPADPDASWGHRNTNTPGTSDGLFFGYYAQAVTMVGDEGGAEVAELIRRVSVVAPKAEDPPRTMAAILVAMAEAGIPVGDVLADSGYANRLPSTGPARWPASGPDWSKTFTPPIAGPRAPLPGPLPATAGSTARPHRARCWTSGPSGGQPPQRRWSPTISPPPKPPATSSVA